MSDLLPAGWSITWDGLVLEGAGPEPRLAGDIVGLHADGKIRHGEVPGSPFWAIRNYDGSYQKHGNRALVEEVLRAVPVEVSQ